MYDPQQVELANAYLDCAMDIGENLYLRGAEIHRVEDTVQRIGMAYGASRVDVFTITYTMVVTMKGEAFGTLTQSRRMAPFSYNLHGLERLNDWSRAICARPMTPEEIKAGIARAIADPPYPQWFEALAYVTISAGFTVFFGGKPVDAVVSGLIGIAIKLVEIPLKKLKVNRFFVVCLCAAAAGFLATTAVRLGFGASAEKISIGNIMVLIPGLMFTNAIRDIFMDNIISGGVRFLEAVFLSVAIAFGFALAHFTLGGY